MKFLLKAFLCLCGFLALSSHAYATNYEAFARGYYDTYLKELFSQDSIYDEIKSLNQKNKGLSLQDFIDRQVAWQKNTEAKDYQGFLNMSFNMASLAASQAHFNADGLVLNVIVTDRYGESLGQAIFSTNYWFRKVFHRKDDLPKGALIDVSGVEYDPLTRRFFVKSIFPLWEGNVLIGSLVVLFDAEEIELFLKGKEVLK